MAGPRAARMRKELEQLENEPPHGIVAFESIKHAGISAWPVKDKLDELEART